MGTFYFFNPSQVQISVRPDAPKSMTVAMTKRKSTVNQVGPSSDVQGNKSEGEADSHEHISIM